MANTDYERLLRRARAVLERYQFDGDVMRDDVAQICMQIDDVLPDVASPATAVANPQMLPREQLTEAA